MSEYAQIMTHDGNITILNDAPDNTSLTGSIETEKGNIVITNNNG